MPPKNKFTKEEIVDAAFEIAVKEGFAGITARSVANCLKSSVAPIYVNFKNIDELTAEVVKKISALGSMLIADQKKESLFENIGLASLEFAHRYPVLFREFVLKPNPYHKSFEAVHEEMIDALAAEKSMKSLSFENRKRLFLKMQIFQTGLSVMIANNLLHSSINKTEAAELLMETGKELLHIHKNKEKRGKK